MKKALIFNTSDTIEERENAELHDPLESIWGRCVLPYCGVKIYERHIFRAVVGSLDDERQRWLMEAGVIALRLYQT